MGLPSPPGSIKSRVAKLLTQFPSRRLWLHPSQFLSCKFPYCSPRAGFCGRMKTRTLPAPHSGSSNCKEDKKIIGKPFYSTDIASTDFFLFPSDLAGLTFPQESFKTSCRGSSKPSPRTSPPTPFGDRWTSGEKFIQICCE